MPFTTGADKIKVASVNPMVSLFGTEVFSKHLVLRENGGNLEIYDANNGVVLFTFATSSIVMKEANPAVDLSSVSLQNASDVSYSNGLLGFTSHGCTPSTYPWIIMSSFSIDPTVYTLMNIVYKVDDPDITHWPDGYELAFYWTGSAYSHVVPIIPDGQWRIAVIDLSADENWTGTITGDSRFVMDNHTNGIQYKVGPVFFSSPINNHLLWGWNGAAVTPVENIISASSLKLTGSIPFIELSGSEGSGADLIIRENAGNVEIVNSATGLVIKTLITTLHVCVDHLPILCSTGGAETAATAWKEVVFEAPPGSAITITDAGVIPDYGATFGQATSYFRLSLVNKGSDGAGTTVLAYKDFNTAAPVMRKTSFGSIANPALAAGDVLTIEKTITSSGMIAQACEWYIEYTRVS